MKILSFGEIIWDVYPDEKTLGGAPLNLAAHAALQGAEAYLLSAVGPDDEGREALAALEGLGVNTSLVHCHPSRPTGVCRVTLDGAGVPRYALAEHTAYDAIPAPSGGGEYGALCFGTLALRESENMDTLRRVMAENRFSEIYTDLNIRPPYYSEETVRFCLSAATLVKISDEELPTVLSLLGMEDAQPREAARLIAAAFPQIRLLLVTCGAKGALCYDASRAEYRECPATPATVVSTVGAGDSFGAAFLVSYLDGRDISAALSRASAVSAFVVSRRAAVPADLPAALRGGA